MKRFIRNIFITVYAIIAIFITVCLLSYNDYKVTEFGSYSLVIVDNDKIEPAYNKGDLVIVDKSKYTEINDMIFFYKASEGTMTISYARVINKEEISDTETTYMLEGEKAISSDYLIGKAEGSKKIEKIGTVLQVLQSKWGFLILVVLPALLAFLYEVGEVIVEVRGKRKNNGGKREREEKSEE